MNPNLHGWDKEKEDTNTNPSNSDYLEQAGSNQNEEQLPEFDIFGTALNEL